MDRGEFFATAFNLVARKCADVLLDNPVVQALEKKLIPGHRPPGALSDDGVFKERCTGCDQCMIACPVDCIMVEDLDRRHPIIYPEESPCIRCEGFPCISACPTGALTFQELRTPEDG